MKGPTFTPPEEKAFQTPMYSQGMTGGFWKTRVSRFLKKYTPENVTSQKLALKKPTANESMYLLWKKMVIIHHCHVSELGWEYIET